MKICVPYVQFVHHQRNPLADQTVLCAKYGVNVMTEKPMATRWNDGNTNGEGV